MMISSEQLSTQTVETLRDVLRELDDQSVSPHAALHIQWAIDLLNEANKLSRIPTPA